MIAAMSYNLSAFGADRAAALYAEGTISHVRCPLWPLEPAAIANRAEWSAFVSRGVPMWGWLNCSADQFGDVIAMSSLDVSLDPAGWVLDIEGEWTKGAKLDTLVAGAKALGKPVIASLAGYSASHVEYDYRALDRAGIPVEWQAYADSGEGPTPAEAVRELYESSFVIPGWEYRSRIGATYGWGQVTGAVFSTGYYDTYKFPRWSDREFGVAPRDWGWTVTDREFAGVTGRLLGRARYSLIRVALIVSREIEQRRTLAEWTAYAASARIPGASRRGVAVFPVENCSDELLRAIAAGAA